MCLLSAELGVGILHYIQLKVLHSLQSSMKPAVQVTAKHFTSDVQKAALGSNEDVHSFSSFSNFPRQPTNA